MKIHFQKNEHLNDGDIEITLSAKERSLEIDELIAYLKSYRTLPPAVVPIKSDDHVYLFTLSRFPSMLPLTSTISSHWRPALRVA